MSDHSTKEFRLKNGPAILAYIRRFSATEKAIFGILVIGLIISALILTKGVSDLFMVEIPADGGVLREALTGLPRTVNPILAVTDADRDLTALTYSGLTSYRNGQLAPDLATHWSISTDGLTYTFDLRTDAHFSDGTPVTADDVAFTVQKIQDPGLKSPRAADWADVTTKVISASKIQFSLKQAYSPFLANTTIGILPKHIWSLVSDDQFIFDPHNTRPVGSGPYKVTDVTTSGGIPQSYSLSTWSGYYGNIPHLSTISFSFYADQEKALAALNSGQVDSMPSISPVEAARLASNHGEPYRILAAPLPRVFGVFFNQNQELSFADRSVRQALSLTLDRATIVKTALNGYGQAISGPLPVGFIPDSTIAGPNLLQAQSLLEKSGWKKNSATGIYEKKDAKNVITKLSFSIYTADTPDLKQAAELVRKSWNTLGADVSVKVFDPSDLYQNVIRTRKYDALLFGEFIGKDRDLYAFWNSAQRTAPGLNVAMYVNSAADKILDSIRQSDDPAERTTLYGQFDALIRDDAPAAFLYVPDFIYAVPKSLKAVSLSSVSLPSDRFASVGSWYLSTERVWKIFAR